MILGDETTKVFINASGTADDVSEKMRAFLDYIKGKGSTTDFTRQIEAEVNKARVHEEWRVEYMVLSIWEMNKLAQGREEKQRVIVMNMLRDNESVEKICRYVECEEDFVEEVRKELLNSK